MRQSTKITLICQCCGGSFTRFPSNVARGVAKYCSRECRDASRHRRPIEERFWEKVNKDGPIPTHRPELGHCWVWTASTQYGGYGTINRGGDDNIFVGAHILSWEIHNGPVPEGMFVCHHCDNRPCVNPAHIFLGTHQDNVDDMMQKGRNQHGETHHAAKLNPDAVRDIRDRFAAKQANMPQLADQYGVGIVSIWQVIHRKTWEHVA